MNIAQITVSGNVGADPEIRMVNDTKVANLSVAVNEGYTNKQGEKVEKLTGIASKLGTVAMARASCHLSLSRTRRRVLPSLLKASQSLRSARKMA